MGLETELTEARKDVVTDGYDMSIGGIVNLYKGGELIINPGYQRYFRWDDGRKTTFIESLLLGIPIPPIFVFQTSEGVWELVDGLQRISTLLEFMGELKDSDGHLATPRSLDGTRLLPSLAGRTWKGSMALSPAQKLDIKRARMRVEILKRESEVTAKFELFQRLNTGGVSLTPQEVRTCTAIMIDPGFHEWLLKLAKSSAFQKSTDLNEEAKERQDDVELVLRFLSFRNVEYRPGLDVHEYLDGATIQLAKAATLRRDTERKAFESTFGMIAAALGSNAFRRWDGSRFTGKFLISVYEVLVTGVTTNLPKLTALSPQKCSDFVVKRAKGLWMNQTFQKNSGAGVRGSTRLANLLPFARTYFAP